MLDHNISLNDLKDNNCISSHYLLMREKKTRELIKEILVFFYRFAFFRNLSCRIVYVMSFFLFFIEFV